MIIPYTKEFDDLALPMKPNDSDGLEALDPLTKSPKKSKVKAKKKKDKVRRLPYMAYEDQQQITRLCVRCGLLLMQYGAESATVVDLCQRLGKALGVASVECSIAFNGVTITTIYSNRCITTLRASTTQAININIIIQIQTIILDLENMPVTSTLEHATQRFDALDRDNNNHPALVSVMVGIACACFSLLAGGDMGVIAITFIASTVGFAIKHFLAENYFNPFVVGLATAFCTSLLASMTLIFHIGNDPHIAMASSILFLIPSFPLINSLSDILKGYMNIGIGRFMFVMVLSLSVCMGIVFALLLLNVKHWGIL